MSATYEGYNQAAQLHAELAARIATLTQTGKSPETLAAAQALDVKAQGLTDAAGPPPAARWVPMNRDLTRLMIAVDQSDTRAGQSSGRDFHRHVPGHATPLSRAGAICARRTCRS